MRDNVLIKILSCLASVLVIFANVSPALAAPGAAPQAQAADPRFFAQTGFRIDNDKFFDYFQRRGGVGTFGFPVSRTFTLRGATVQFFQRRVLQINPDGGVGQLNLLQGGLLPFTSINFATFPAEDPSLTRSAPAVGSPNYATAALAFVRQHAPNSFGGLPVNFLNTFQSTVAMNVAFPNGGGNSGLLLGFDLEMWGLPISQPAFDPHNHNFVYLRFQRGIMHFDNTTHQTQGILLGDSLKSIITGKNLPSDLAQEARGSLLFMQYNNSKPNGLNNPAVLPNTNLSNAFEPESPKVSPPTGINGLRYGFQVQMFGQNQPALVNNVKNAGFGWIKQQIRWADLEPTRGQIQFGPMDAVANIASANNVGLLFSVVTAPTWSRADGRTNGPPDNLNDFGDFVAALAQRYDGKVQAYEIWNEQNFSREWGGGTINAGAYVELLKVAFRRIKAVDPNIIVVSGALTPTGVNNVNIAVDDTIYLTQMEQYQGGVFKTVADAVGAHMAGYNNPPGDFVDHHTLLAPCHTITGQLTGSNMCFKTNGQFYFRRIDQLHGIQTANQDGRRLWITEYEWGATTPPVPPGFEWTLDLTEDQAGNFLVQSIQMIQQSRPWVGAIFIWNLNFREFADPHTDDSAIFGVLNANGTARSIYTKLAQLRK